MTDGNVCNLTENKVLILELEITLHFANKLNCRLVSLDKDIESTYFRAMKAT